MCVQIAMCLHDVGVGYDFQMVEYLLLSYLLTVTSNA